MLPLRFGVKAWSRASLRAILASPEAACWIRVFVEFEMAYSMQSLRLITFEDSWALELSTGPRVITKYTQIKAIKRALKAYNLHEKIPVYGMVKDDKHSTRALIDVNRKEFKISDNLFFFITNLQNEVHNTAIEYHRKLREKGMTKSELDDIEGIGKVKREALLKKFGTIEKIKQASIEELVEVKGITKNLAKKIKSSDAGNSPG